MNPGDQPDFNTVPIQPPSAIPNGPGGAMLPDGTFKSPNFQADLAGWKIDSNGDVEFNRGTFRGTFVLGGTIITISSILELQDTIDKLDALGGGTVSLTPGTYNATSSFTLPSGVTLEGNGSTIDFGGGAYQILIQGSTAYSTGTLAATFGSANVVGTGTTWTAAMVGQSILIGDYWYEILTRTDNTHITIQYSTGNGFMAPTVSGATYVIATTVDAVKIQNIALQNASGTLLKFRYVNGLNLSGVALLGSGQGLDGDDSANVNFILGSLIDDCTVGMTYDNVPFTIIDGILVSNITGGTGIALTGVTNTSMGSISIQAITGVGLKFTSCYNTGFINFSIIECTSHGIEFVSGNSSIDIISGYLDTLGGDGIKLTATSDTIHIIAQTIKNYTGYAINIAASSCDNNVLVSPTYGGGGSGTLSDSGTGTVIIANASPWTTLKKAADQTKTSDNTLANDNTLAFSVAANTTYVVRMKVFFTTLATPDIRFKFNGPASPTNIAFWYLYGDTVTGGAGTTVFQSNATTYNGLDVSMAQASDYTGFVFFEATIVNGANAGTMAFQWCQATSDAGATVVKKGSWLEYMTIA